MGRTEELKSKFRQKAEGNRRDPALLDFKERINRALISKHAEIIYSSNEWLLDTYRKFKEVDKSKKNEWIETEISDIFKSVGAPPNWLHETTWCFLGNKPLTFVVK